MNFLDLSAALTTRAVILLLTVKLLSDYSAAGVHFVYTQTRLTPDQIRLVSIHIYLGTVIPPHATPCAIHYGPLLEGIRLAHYTNYY